MGRKFYIRKKVFCLKTAPHTSGDKSRWRARVGLRTVLTELSVRWKFGNSLW